MFFSLITPLSWGFLISSFSVSLPHFVFFLGFWLSSSLSHFVGLAIIFPVVVGNHVTETQYAG
jgi:hypothetical protein